jgi:hypothetical protein
MANVGAVYRFSLRNSRKLKRLIMLVFLKCSKERRCLSPVAIKSASASTAHSRIRLSGSSARRWRWE